MNVEKIRQALHSNRPFRIHTADGRTIDVPHQDYAALFPSGKVLFVITSDEREEHLNTALITALEFAGADSAA